MARLNANRSLRPILLCVESCAAVLLVAMMLVGAASAQTYVSTYSLGDGGPWNAAATWSGGVVPNNTALYLYNVSIGTGSKVTEGPTLPETDWEINTLSLSGTLGAPVYVHLTVNGTFDNSGLFSSCNSPGVTVLGNFNNSGTVQAALSSVTVQGDFNNSNVLDAGDGAFAVGGDVNNSGYARGLDTVGGNVNNSGTIYVSVPDSLTAGGNINNSGTVVVSLAGITAVSLNNSGSVEFWSGGLTLSGDLNNSGSLVAPYAGIGVEGSVVNSGILELGYSATAGSFTQTMTGSWVEDFSSKNNFGTLNVTGGLNLAGTLDFGFNDGYMVSLGDTYILATFAPGQLTGTFSTLLDNSFNNGLWKFHIDYDNAHGQVLLTAVDAQSTPEPRTWALLIAGIPVVMAAMRRKQRHARCARRPFGCGKGM